MPLLRAVLVMLSAGERTTLKKRVRGAKTTWRDRLRAQIVLAAARGHPNARIAAGLGISVDTVRKWRGRFAARGLDGLRDRARPGRPRQISAADRAAVVALACQLPAATGVPLGRWTGPELAAELAARGLASPMSASSVLRILAEHPVRPWQYQSWIYPRDPDFEARARVIVDLYQGCYQGEPLGPGDRILSFDAKPQINARRRLGAPGVACCGLRVVSMDGSTSDVPDSPPNDEHFGRPSNQTRDGAFAQVRWLAAAESGTGSLLGASLGPYRDSEQALARDLLEQECFGPGMLVLADRKFLSWALAREFLAAGAHILWRASASFTLKPVKVLADGTYLAQLTPPRKKDGPPLLVRVIEYTVRTTPEDGGGEETSELFCLVTDLLDPGEYLALDLACCYPARWGCETVIGHHKTDMGEGQPVLRSKDPAGVEQEMWALFAVYQAICKIIGIGAAAAGIPPDKISFRHALAAATDTVAAFPPQREQADLALATFLLKILAPGTFIRDRPDRASPRKTKKSGDFPARKPGEPSVTNVIRKIEFHLLSGPHMIT